MRTNENLHKVPRTGDFFIILATEIHSLIRLPFRGRHDRGKGNFSKRGSRYSGELLSSNKLSTYTVSTN